MFNPCHLNFIVRVQMFISTLFQHNSMQYLPHSFAIWSLAFSNITTSFITSTDKQAFSSTVNLLPHPATKKHSKHRFCMIITKTYQPVYCHFIQRLFMAHLHSSPLPRQPTCSLKSSDCPSINRWQSLFTLCSWDRISPATQSGADLIQWTIN